MPPPEAHVQAGGGAGESDGLGTVLVTGASGYVASRLIPRLLENGYAVRAGFTNPDRAGDFWWSPRTRVVELDVLDKVRAAVDGVASLVYLVHSMAGEDFAERDRKAAHLVAEACRHAGVSRIVYLSGIIPPIPAEELSEHLASRVEVERILTESGIPTFALRAAVVVGAGSTSFEIIRQISERMPVHTIPQWMDSEVQPIAVVDVVQAILGALTVPGASRHYDIGGPDRMPYAQLLSTYTEVAGLTRPQVPLPAVSSDVVGMLAGLVTDVPSSTVEALIESLHHDMVASEDDFARELMPAGYSLLDVRTGFRRALAEPANDADPASLDPMGPLAHDPDWAGGQGGGVGWAIAGVSAVISSIVDRVT